MFVCTVFFFLGVSCTKVQPFFSGEDTYVRTKWCLSVQNNKRQREIRGIHYKRRCKYYVITSFGSGILDRLTSSAGHLFLV